MSGKHKLKLDWCTYEAAKYAVLNYHYSRCMPAGKLVKIGVWENDVFIGTIIYGRGAAPPVFKSLNLKQTELCELVRVALKNHKTPVSRIIAISLRMLLKLCPGLKACISFADSEQNHHGGIYQAGNWLYLGESIRDVRYLKNGKLHHPRSLGAKYGRRDNSFLISKGYKVIDVGIKHRYLYLFDKKLLSRYKIYPYPKRAASIDNDAPSDQLGEGGAIPTAALHSKQAVLQDDKIIANN